MSILGSSFVTVSDMLAMTRPDGSLETEVVNRVAKTNGLFSKLPFMKGNKTDGHQQVQLVTVPTVGYITYNVAPTTSKAGRVQRTDTVGTISTYSKVDPNLAKDQDNPEAFRKSEDIAFLESTINQASTDIIYANSASEALKFDGLAVRYGTVNTTRHNSGYYMINGGGSGSDNTSIYVAKIGPGGLMGLVGKNGTIGIQTIDHGDKVWIADSAGTQMPYMVTEIKLELGLTVKNPGAVVRICNIDKSALVTESSAANLQKLIFKAAEMIENVDGQTAVICNRTVKAHLGIQAFQKTTLGLHAIADTWGEHVEMIPGVGPVIVEDAITNAEATISGTFSSDF